MRAAITLDKHKIEVRDIDVPAIGPEEALIKVKYTGICGTDAHIYNGTFPLLNYPLVPGHEFVGELADINTKSPQLKGFKPGDPVVAQHFFACDVCDTCSMGGDHYCNDIKVLGVHINGSMAEYVRVPAKKLIKMDKNTDMKLMVLTEPLAVGVHSVTKSGFTVGDTAFIIGAGVIGVMIAIAARVAGASKIILCDINEYRLDFVRSLGFEVMDSREPDFFERLMVRTDGKGFDKVFEATGTSFGIKLMTAAAKRGGIIVQTGISAENHPINVRSFSDKEIQVRGVRNHPFSDFKIAFNILQQGKETEALKKVITDVFPLEKAAEAFDFQIKNGNHFKVVVENENF
jgi:2-desacetyl-2-hydroxyethyl bacteriochlorophyllide A dehydrogenase